MEPLVLVVTLALLGEVLIEVLKPLVNPVVSLACEYVAIDPERGYLYISAFLGVLLAALYRADLLIVIGLPELAGAGSVFGVVATGLIIGRGANFVHDVFSRLAPQG